MKILADENIPKARELFSAHGEVKTFQGRNLDPELLSDVDALLVRSITKVSSELLESSSVKFVGTSTIGTDHVDTQWLKEHKIGFSNAPGCNAIAVAEYVLSGLFVISSDFKLDLRTARVGIIGAGNVGSALATRLGILGIPYVLYDPPLATLGDHRTMVELDDLVDCDILTCHVPLTTADQSEWPTYHMVNAEFLNAMDSLQYFINTSRGSVVDTGALLDWLNSSPYHQAINDVWENEPQIDADLLEASLIGTPHIAGHSYEGKVRGTIMLYQAFCEHFHIDCDVDSNSLLTDKLPKDVITLKQDLNYMQAMSSALWRVYNIRDDDKALRAGLKKDMTSHFDRLRRGYKIRRECSAHRIDEVSAPDGALKTLKQLGFRV
jgi:erythronate-4-phosphate dehydrogenase